MVLLKKNRECYPLSDRRAASYTDRRYDVYCQNYSIDETKSVVQHAESIIEVR